MITIEECDLVKLEFAKLKEELSDEKNLHLNTTRLLETYKEYATAHSILNDRCSEENAELNKKLSKEKTKTSILSGVGLILILVILL
jgi:predicted molibdopterin-dependent oxidoreductase YjgC